jgi:hypothetical protein
MFWDMKFEDIFGLKGWAILIIVSILFGLGWHMVKAYALKDEAEMIAYNISTTPYHIVYYNCWDFSTDLYNALKERGYNPKIMMGMTDSYKAHAWIELDNEWIESITGQIIYDRSNYKFYYYGRLCPSSKSCPKSLQVAQKQNDSFKNFVG